MQERHAAHWGWLMLDRRERERERSIKVLEAIVTYGAPIQGHRNQHVELNYRR